MRQWLSDLQESSLMISFHHDKISILKDREGEIRDVDLAGLLEAIAPYCEGFQPLVKKLVEKLKVYRPFI